MKILFVASVFPNINGGIADYTCHLIESLRGKKYELHLLTSDDQRIMREGKGFKIHAHMRSWSIKDFQTVRKVIDEIGPDVIHIQHDTISQKDKKYLLNALPFLIQANYKRPKVITTIHEFREHRLRWKMRILPNVIFSDKCIFVDTWDMEAIRRQFFFVSKKKLSYIPIGANITPSAENLGIPKGVIRKRLNLEEGAIILFHFGTISPHKGLNDLLDALEKITPREERVRLLLISGLFAVGHKMTAYQKDFIARIGNKIFRDKILTLENQDEETLSLYMLASDIGVFPFTFGASYQRGSLLASLAHGLPVITTFHPKFYPPFIDNGKDVILIKVGDREALYENLIRLIEDGKMREEIGQNGRIFYETHFSWRDIAEKTSALYDEVMH